MRTVICDRLSARAGTLAALMAAQSYQVRIVSPAGLSAEDWDLLLIDQVSLDEQSTLLRNENAQVMVLLDQNGVGAVHRLLSAQADDYLLSPIRAEVLTLRLALVKRRLDQQAFESESRATVRLDMSRRCGLRRGNPVHLTPQEYSLLSELVGRSGRPSTLQMLRQAIWGSAEGGTLKALQALVRSTRGKLESDPDAPRFLLTDPDIGYRWCPDGA